MRRMALKLYTSFFRTRLMRILEHQFISLSVFRVFRIASALSKWRAFYLRNDGSLCDFSQHEGLVACDVRRQAVVLRKSVHAHRGKRCSGTRSLINGFG